MKIKWPWIRRFKRDTSSNENEVRSGTHVMDIQWHRSEELRPDRLGPTEDDVRPEHKYRPSRTLGPIPR